MHKILLFHSLKCVCDACTLFYWKHFFSVEIATITITKMKNAHVVSSSSSIYQPSIFYSFQWCFSWLKIWQAADDDDNDNVYVCVCVYIWQNNIWLVMLCNFNFIFFYFFGRQARHVKSDIFQRVRERKKERKNVILFLCLAAAIFGEWWLFGCLVIW